MRIALAQMNSSVGDLAGNARRILHYAEQAAKTGCDLLITPELALTGYPPLDLVYKRHFVAEQRAILYDALVPFLPVPALVGFVDNADGEVKQDEVLGSLYNAAAFIADGAVREVVHKRLLPTYDVFDEWRHFTPGTRSRPIDIGGVLVGVTICEDLWDDEYEAKPARELAADGARIIVNLSSSPYRRGKWDERLDLLTRHAREIKLPLLYCNMIGAQDELIFDGRSFCLSAGGQLAAQADAFREQLIVLDVDPASGAVEFVPQSPPPASDSSGLEAGLCATAARDGMAELFAALCLGIADYFDKCGFRKAVIGLSGGVDSALTVCLAAEALGPQQVIAVAMPSQYNAPESTSDAEHLARKLGVEFHVMPIEESVQLAMRRYRAAFGDYTSQLTVENLQARERGKILMEISNDRTALVLSTGNKTEYALGYTTLYGDMCGGLAALGDVSKPLVYELSRFYNELFNQRGGTGQCIPEHTLTRPPSAELREGQVDPFDYERISPLADLVIEQQLSPNELAGHGYTREEVELVMRLVQSSEYKRKQAPPILRVSSKAFGIGRRMPIANAYPR